MGDISTEPSMEEILSSIKRIIAEEGDGDAPAPRGRRGARAASASRAPVDEDEVLELRNAVDRAIDEDAGQATRARRAEQPRRAARDERDCDEAEPAVSKAEFEAILSERAAEASRGQLEALSRMIVKPARAGGEAGAGSETLEGLVREMLRPMLSEWLDANLPQIVEKMVAREIARITGRNG